MKNQSYKFTQTESLRLAPSFIGPMPASNLHSKISSTVIRRLNFPKHIGSAGKVGKDGVTRAISREASLNAKSRPMLSEAEEMDICQTVAFSLVATGAMERGKLTLGDWKEIFRAVRGPDCLRIDRRSKNVSEIVSVDTMTEEALAIISAKLHLKDNPLNLVKRKIQARKIRYERDCIRAAFQADTSRKRVSYYRKAREILRHASHFYASGKGNSISDVVNSLAGFEDGDAQKNSFNQAKGRFLKYRDEGEAILTGQAMANIAPRTLKSFADICTGKGLIEV